MRAQAHLPVHTVLTDFENMNDQVFNMDQHNTYTVYRSVVFCKLVLLGGSGEVVNSFEFCPASFKSLGCFYFRCVLSLQWKAVTVNLRILHCQL